MAAHAEVRVMRRNALLVLACVAAGAGTALAVTATSTRVYQSEAEVFVAAGHTANAGGVYDRARFAQERVKSYLPLVTSPTVMAEVVRQLGLPIAPDRLVEKVTVSAAPDTVLIRISARDTSAKQAQGIANATAAQFAKFASTLEGQDEGAASVELRITKPAEQSRSPVSPRPRYNFALGLFLGAVTGLAVAALRERWSPTGPSPDPDQRSTALTVEPPERPTDVPVDEGAASWPPPRVIKPPPARRPTRRAEG